MVGRVWDKEFFASLSNIVDHSHRDYGFAIIDTDKLL
jgi:hypothetical protein